MIASLFEFSLEYRGRALRENIDGLGLKKGDRLVLTNELPDVALFEQAVVPCVAIFSV
jgi:hypothetical protein